MEQEFVFFFLSWSQNKKVYLVGGSDKKKIERQVPSSVIRRCAGMFCCMGNEFWQDEELIYKNNWKSPIELTADLCKFRMNSPYPTKRNNYLEERGGMLNFSVAGRDSNAEERKRYWEWDKANKEREKIVEKISKDFPELEAKIGGQISIDIQPKGHNKSQASRWVRKNIDENIFFAGDKCFEGGNDHDIYLDVKKHGGSVFQVRDWKDTREVLTRLDRGEIFVKYL